MHTNPGAVGEILIKSGYDLNGQRMLADFRQWLSESGWKDGVNLSFEFIAGESVVELIPGDFQSNGPKKISLANMASFTEFKDVLHKWFWEVEEPVN